MSIKIKKNGTAPTDWAFLLFLVGAVNVKLYIKVLAVFAYMLYIWYKKYPLPKPNRLNQFYLFIPIAGTIGSLLHGSFATDTYIMGYALGIVQWGLIFLISYITFVTVLHKPEEQLKGSVKVFFLLNFLFSIGELIWMIYQSGHFPYWYWEPTEYYGTSTGDHIKGLFMSNSITNAMVGTLGVIYYLYQRQLKWAVVCLLTVLMCTSNITIAFLLMAIFLVFIFVKKRQARKYSIIAVFTVLVVYPLLTPSNLRYIATTYNKQVEEQKIARRQEKKIDTVIIKKDAVQMEIPAPYQTKRDYFIVHLNNSVDINYAEELAYLKYFATFNREPTSNVILNQHAIHGAMDRWYSAPPQYSPLSSYHKPAKIYTFRQTQYFLKDNWKNATFGAGIGNFSSKLAIKMTDLGLQGDYPTDYRYISTDFLQGHFYSLLYILAKPVADHSIIQMPYSIYNQIAGEYGIIGFAVFAFFYLGFCIKNYKKLKAGRYLLVLILIFFGFEYWFEMMSLTVIFELMIFLDVYKNKDADTGTQNIRTDAGV